MLKKNINEVMQNIIKSMKAKVEKSQFAIKIKRFY